jgi:5-methyltetrahydrofolate--homocysteine methyltransferase
VVKSSWLSIENNQKSPNGEIRLMTNIPFIDRLKAGEIFVADGATGTNLYERGLSRGSSPENWVLDQPEQILRLHKDFLAAGADIILTCTFGGSSVRLHDTSLEGRAVEVNQRAAFLALQARQGTNALVGGSLGPLGKLLKPIGPLTPEEALASYAEQARTLSNSGVDLLVIETQFDLAEAQIAVQAARSVSSLPIITSFSYDRGKKTMMGLGPTKAVAEMAKLSIDVIGINCGRSLEDNLANLQELRPVTTLPIWFKPNAGLPRVDESGNPVYDLTPEQMGAQAAQWIAAGAQIVGGCCGTTPAHLNNIAQNARPR